MKKVFAAVVIISVMLSNISAFAQNNKNPNPKAMGAVLMDAKSGRVLWGKNECEPMPMASTTKIMTAIIAIESGRLDETVIVSKNAASAPPVKLKLSAGEEHRLEDLLYPLMLESANDAAVAIAEHIGGSVEEFCSMMNQKAIMLGCEDTIFETPNGLDKGEHHSTAKDMAIISAYALKNEKFVDIIGTRQITIPIKNKGEKSYSITNKNRLLNEYEGAIGVKTGFTAKAGQCFVGAAEKGDMMLISVVLASGWGNAGKEQKWIDTKSLLNYGFNNYKNHMISQNGDFIENAPVINSKGGSARLIVKDTIVLPLSNEEIEGLRVKIKVSEDIDAPVKKGEALGYMHFISNDGKYIARTDIISENSVDKKDFSAYFEKLIKFWINPGEQSILLFEN